MFSIVEHPPLFYRFFFKESIWRIKGEGKKVYLTFDDGPIPEVTPWVLALLDQYDIKATFFCVGENVFNYPDIYREILQRGHKVGNHTYNHLQGWKTPTASYLANVKKASEYVQSNLFRPPHGHLRISQNFYLRKHYRMVMWDVITRDYNANLSGDEVFDIVKRYTRNGSIIVFHDSLKSKDRLYHALPLAIEWLLKEGYEFAMIPDRKV